MSFGLWALGFERLFFLVSYRVMLTSACVCMCVDVDSHTISLATSLRNRAISGFQRLMRSRRHHLGFRISRFRVLRVCWMKRIRTRRWISSRHVLFFSRLGFVGACVCCMISVFIIRHSPIPIPIRHSHLPFDRYPVILITRLSALDLPDIVLIDTDLNVDS